MKKLKQQSVVELSAATVPYEESYLFVDCFNVTKVFDHLFIQFGALLPNSDRTSICIELAFPISAAAKSIYHENFELPSLGNPDPLIKVLQKSTKQLEELFGNYEIKQKFELPQDPSSYRKISSNHMQLYCGHDQGCMEFFQVPVPLIVDSQYGRPLRENSELQHVISLACSIKLQLEFLNKAHELLAPFIGKRKQRELT